MKRLIVTIVCSCCMLCCLNVTGQLRLPAFFRDSMVLQRNVKVPVWGWAAPGERVTVTFNRKKIRTRAGDQGQWRIELPPTPPGGPFVMEIAAGSRLTLRDILVGDVWICSGQSNMVHQMSLHSVLYEKDIEEANYPAIRHFAIPTTPSLQGPQPDFPSASWKAAVPEDVPGFSAVAYFFAKQIYDKYHIPIGLINASVGGTPIEAWIGETGFANFSRLHETVLQNKDTAYVNERIRQASADQRPRLSGYKIPVGPIPWYSTAYEAKGWRNIHVPGYWEDQGIHNLDGIVWYRKEIEVPPSMTGKAATIFLGRIVDADQVYLNGEPVGRTTYMYPQRRYALPAGKLKPGKNLLVVRVQNNGGKGGFVPDKPYYIKAGDETLDLMGTWTYKVAEAYLPQRGAPGRWFSMQNQPASLYNGMIAPLKDFPVKGFLWYQGESNTGRTGEYKELMHALIQNWRNRWNMPDAPFLWVQLPGFMDINYLPAESQWAQLREAQLQSLEAPHTAMAVAIDLGEWNDIHPDRKKEVGERLALAARKLAYGEKDLVASGPVYDSSRVEGNRIRLYFSHTGSGLVTIDGEALKWFAIAGSDKKFVWAKAEIEGNTIVVHNEAIQQPMYVRYAWADNPEGANLYNKEGLPASPFRTDQ